MTVRHLVVPSYLILCLLLGGASAAGYAANLTLQLVALPLIGWSLWSLTRRPARGSALSLLCIVGLFLTIMVLQLVPLPPAIWTMLPGRQPLANGFRLMGIPLPWQRLSMAPDNTIDSLLWLLPAFAVILSVLALGAFRARWIAFAILGTAAISVAIGALQVVGGEGSSWYFYEITNFGVAVGVFANANHNATLLLISIPFLAAVRGESLQKARSVQQASAITLTVSAGFVVIVIGLITNLSLAGIGLSVPVSLASYFLIIKGHKPQWWALMLCVLASAITIATIIIGPFHNNLIGKQESNVDLSRQTSFALTWRASREYFPVGSGVGSFQTIYDTQENPDATTTTFMNHAHSDWLEVLLETGLSGILLIVLLVWWWFRRAGEIIGGQQTDFYGRASMIASATVVCHSVVDYPLRTAAVASLFCTCLALMAKAKPHVKPARSDRRRARHFGIDKQTDMTREGPQESSAS